MALTAVPAYASADWRQGSVIRNFVAGEALTILQAVYLHTDGKVYKADANVSTAVVRAVGVVVAAVNLYGETAIAAGQNCSVVVFGPIYGFTDMTIGGQVFVSTTPGVLTQTAPSSNAYQFVIGYAAEDDVLFINPEADAAASV